MIIVLLEEYTIGSNEAESRSDFKNQFKLDVSASGALDFIPGMGGKSIFDGDNEAKGSTSRKGSLKGKLAARVVEVLGNENLRLEGRRTIEVNGEKQIIILKGMVRSNDISADNTVYSFLIADAEIILCGKGQVDQASKPGIITRIFAWLF